MTKGEAIKYLQQLYPNGGHCWLDEQRIEAIGMAIKALQEEPVSDTQSPVVFYGLTGSVGNTKEVPVSEDLEYASEKYACRFSSSKYGHDKVKDSFIAGANWQKEQMMKDAKSGIGNYDNYIKFEDGTWIDLDPSEQLKPAFNVNEGDKVKVIVIKEK